MGQTLVYSKKVRNASLMNSYYKGTKYLTCYIITQPYSKVPQQPSHYNKPNVYFVGLSFTLDNMYSNERILENFKQRKLFEGIQCLNKDGKSYICEYKNDSSQLLFVDTAAWRPGAFYRFQRNMMVLCAGVLQDVLFNGEAPRYVNFGASGVVFGHEVTHGYDSDGSLFGFNGRCVTINLQQVVLQIIIL